MQLSGLKDRLQPHNIARLDNLSSERVLNRLRLIDAASLGARAGGVEVHRVQTLVVFEGAGLGGGEEGGLWCVGRGGARCGGGWGGAGDVASGDAGGGRRGFAFDGGGEDGAASGEGVGCVDDAGDVLVGRVVEDFFDAGVVGHGAVGGGGPGVSYGLVWGGAGRVRGG